MSFPVKTHFILQVSEWQTAYKQLAKYLFGIDASLFGNSHSCERAWISPRFRALVCDLQKKNVGKWKSGLKLCSAYLTLWLITEELSAHLAQIL